ncbi:IS66 family insertion sequence element accessory protein TnpB [Rhizobium sp. BK008]|uniref:IS66 family insertion sequence element accessory protein TnpB n=1 Tax=Rhizobium sp. BK008 TaxID=2587094 RepID=UPI00161BE521
MIDVRSADRVKIVWWDGSGVCLYSKRLEKAQFCWPRIGHNRVQLNHAQLMALVDGMERTASSLAATAAEGPGRQSPRSFRRRR